MLKVVCHNERGGQVGIEGLWSLRGLDLEFKS